MSHLYLETDPSRMELELLRKDVQAWKQRAEQAEASCDEHNRDYSRLHWARYTRLKLHLQHKRLREAAERMCKAIECPHTHVDSGAYAALRSALAEPVSAAYKLEGEP
jgi:hypothetical protein